MKNKILITGAAGFIGSEFLKQSIKQGYSVVAIDKLTYAGDLTRLKEVEKKYKFYKIDVCDRKRMSTILKKEKPKIIVHFAAETHVDRSIRDATPFIETNVKGTQVLLDVSRQIKIKKFIHISTDEVYGEIKKGKFSENSSLCPNSPYSASKAAADLIINAYIRTYGFPAIIIRPCNTYGPWQYPEKFIPVATFKALTNNKIPVYGDGANRREWLYVSDCARGILKVMNRGKVGQIYNLGSSYEKKNIDLAKEIIRVLGKSGSLIDFVKDRSGHDFRYCLDYSKLSGLGWEPQVNFNTGISKTIDWYVDNYSWLKEKVKYLRSYWKQVYKSK